MDQADGLFEEAVLGVVLNAVGARLRARRASRHASAAAALAGDSASAL